jgi:hypothetical protein
MVDKLRLRTCELGLRAMQHRAEFFCIARNQNTNVSAFVTAVKATVLQKQL